MLPLYLIGTAAVTENLLKRKWSTIILRHLDNGRYIPAEICQQEPDLTPLAINERLRTMQRYSLVTRYPRNHGPKKIIEYRLTPRGQKILKMLTLIEQLDEVSDKSEITLPEDVTPPAARIANEPPSEKYPRKKPRRRKAG